jgi:hypothetical protein
MKSFSTKFILIKKLTQQFDCNVIFSSKKYNISGLDDREEDW